MRKRKGGETIDKWASPRTRSAESRRLSPGRGVAYGFQAEENGSQAHKIGLGARQGGHYVKMDRRTSLDRLQAYCKWEISV